ncbi:ABC transporter substrate-binding protein [Sporomusa aerivorans]|uniref:ABC transporter substrate-binding protein n=1 Tax=Sporomusa aerivorans TaxID=204936 RepID=UPI00352B6BAD
MNRKWITFLLTILITAALVTTGCGSDKKTATEQDNSKTKTERIYRIGYWGGTCEAPIFAAYENKVAEKLGIKVELVLMASKNTAEMLSTGKVDAVLSSPGSFKGIEQGMDLVLINTAHTGCIQASAPINSPINSAADLKGKRVGVDAMGGPFMAYISNELKQHGIDPKTEVEWKVYPPPQLQTAMDKGEIDCFGTWDPFPQIPVNEGKAKIIWSNTTMSPYKDYTCCFVGVTGKVVREEPEAAKNIQAFFQAGGELCKTQPDEVARMMVEKKYTGGTPALNVQLIKAYQWFSDPARGLKDWNWHVKVFKDVGIFDASTNPEELIKKSYKILQ